MTTTHSLAERLRARADEEAANANDAHLDGAADEYARNYAARVLREEAAALDALTPDPAPGNSPRKLDGSPVDLRREVAERIAKDVFARVRKHAKDLRVAQWYQAAALVGGMGPTDSTHVLVDVIERLRGRGEYEESLPIAGGSGTEDLIATILDKHLSADDEERAALEAIAEAGERLVMHANNPRYFREAVFALRAVRARRKTT